MNSHDEIRPTDFDDITTQDEEDVVAGWPAPAHPEADAEDGVPE